MKLKVYQQGGGLIYTPFIPEQVATQYGGTSTAKSSSGDSEDKIDPLDKEILNLMKGENLLSNDVNLIYDKLISFQRRTQNLSSLGGTDGYRSVMPGMLQIMKLVENAKINKAEWDEKVAEIKKHNAGAEVAMDSTGKMWVQDSEKGLTLVKPTEFDPEKHTPISNSQLIALRRRDPRLAFNDDILGDTGLDVIGGADLRKEIDDIIDKAGTIKQTELKGIPFKAIAQDLEGEGIYKVTQKYSKAELEGFAKLLYSQLSAPAKHLVAANAALGGLDTLSYINAIITSRTDDESPEYDYQASLTKAAGLGGSGGSGADGDDAKNLKERNWTEMLASGSNFEPEKYTYFNPVSTVTMHAVIQNTGIMKKNDGETTIGPGMIDAIKEEVGWFGTLSGGQYSVTFGDQIFDQDAQGLLMYDGSAVQRIKLPYKEVNGELTVNWDLVEELEKANAQLKGATPGMIEDILANHPELVYNKNTGVIEAKNSMWFITFGAIAGDDFVDGLNKDSRYIEKMSDEKSDFWQKRYEEAIKYGFVNHDKNDPERTDHHKTKWFGPFGYNTDFYHGNVFVPIIRTMGGSKEYYPAATHMHNMQTYAQREWEAQVQREVETDQRQFNW